MNATPPQTLTVYTDGSEWRGFLGYAAVCLFWEHRRELTGCEPGRRADRAELRAIRLALSSVAPRKRASCFVVVITDAQTIAESLSGRQTITPLAMELAETAVLMQEFAFVDVRWERRGTTEHNRRAHWLANCRRRNASNLDRLTALAERGEL